jgi:hypothetical protein
MKVLDLYVFDGEGKELYNGTKFCVGKDEYLGKSHGYTYACSRKALKEIGIKMGLDGEIKE